MTNVSLNEINSCLKCWVERGGDGGGRFLYNKFLIRLIAEYLSMVDRRWFSIKRPTMTVGLWALPLCHVLYINHLSNACEILWYLQYEKRNFRLLKKCFFMRLTISKKTVKLTTTQLSPIGACFNSIPHF